jgi:hypothetical protein
MARQTPPTSNNIETVQIVCSENGFTVIIGAYRDGTFQKTYTFETFASMSKWLSKNLVNGV